MSLLDKISKPISSVTTLNGMSQSKTTPSTTIKTTLPQPSLTQLISKPIAQVIKPNLITAKSTPSYAPKALGIDPFKLVPGAIATGEAIKQKSITPLKEYSEDVIAKATGYKKDETTGKYVKGDIKEQIEASQNFVLGFVGGPEGATKSALNARKIAQSVEEDVISKVLREEVPTLAEAESKAFAKVFKDISDEKDVMTAINRIKTQKKTPEQATMELPKETKSYKSADDIVNYVDEIDRSIENPDFMNESNRGILPFTKKQIKSSKQYELREMDIDELIKKDLDLKEYIDANQQRYKGDRDFFNLENPIVVGKNGEVYDGMNRILTLKNNGEKTIKAYVPVETKSPVSLQPQKDVSKPTDPEQQMVELTKSLPPQKLETGFKSIDEILPSFDEENRELTEMMAKEESKGSKEVSDIKALKDTAPKEKAHIESLKMQSAINKELVLDNPARQLSKYTNKKTGELPEVTGNPKSIFAQKGDDIVTQLGFKDSEEARAAYEKYVKNRERYLKTKKNITEISKDFTEKKQILEAVTKKLRKEGLDRKRRVDSIQEFFNLTDAEMKEVTKGTPDYRLITEEKFNDILKGLEGKAFEAFQLSEARAKVEFTIFDKELIKVDNLLKAMKLPEIKNMSRKQLLQLNELMRSFKTGDEFLGVRQLETVQNTDLAGVKTKREVLEDLAKRTGMPYSELFNIQVGWYDKYLYDVALARQSPFHRIMVEDTSKALANANVRYFEFKDKLNTLMQRARASKSRSFVDRLVPTDDIIFDYLDSDSGTKLTLSSKMTGDELNAARFIQEKYAEVRDYLVSKGQLDRYRTNYITHIERGFLEAMRDAVKPKYINGKKISTGNVIKRTTQGILQGLKEMLNEYKQQEAVFNIMNEKTGEVLPLEKFFKFSMKRTGELVPTKNVSKAVLAYMQAFEKKAALDSIVPKIDIYAHSITPNGMTQRGLDLDDKIKRFVKEWLNTKRGRVVDVKFVTPGGPVDWAIRSLIAFTRMIDLGINVPVGLASNVGEQVMTVINIGFAKTALGATRALTPQGRKISQKYAGFVGERMIDKLRDTSKNIGDKFSESIFGLFSAASRRANIEHLLGSMTPQEFAKGEISAKRLGELRLEIGKYRVIDQGESILGKTAPGKMFTQYKSWAVGSLHSSLHNLNVLQKMLRKGKNPIHSREFQELLRGTLMSVFIGVATYGAYSRLRDTKDRSFLEQLAFKSINDAYSILAGMNPALWTSPVRVASFIDDLANSLSAITVSLATGERTKEDKNIKGLSQFGRIFTPALIRTIKSIPFEDLIPKKPSANLQGIKLTPRKRLDIKADTKSKIKGIKLVPKKKLDIKIP